MRLGELNQLLAPWLESGFAPEYCDIECSGACSDSREVVSGMLFCGIRGAVTDGARFIPRAVADGAVAVITDSAAEVPCGIPVLRLRSGCGYHGVARVAAAFAGYPARRLRLFGITGTCGKTTTAFLFRDIMRAAGISCGMIGTVVYDTGDGEIEADRTTPTPFIIQKLLKRLHIGYFHPVKGHQNISGLDALRICCAAGADFCDVNALGQVVIILPEIRNGLTLDSQRGWHLSSFCLFCSLRKYNGGVFLLQLVAELPE
jgi:hypothetical protein